MQTAVLLHNIRSAHNVGSIFRTSDGAGVSKIFLSGYTPRPLDRFGRTQKEIAKTALGAHTWLPWEYAKDPITIITKLRKEGWQIVGVEQDARSIDYRTFKPAKPTLLIFGNEVRGISPALRARCDTIIEIPMHGKKESLNVAVSAGIVLFGTRN
jgi:tRNA G18 (ribose-2'-O)-methylase SpoU